MAFFTVIPQDRETKKWQENLKLRASLLPCIYCMQKLNYRDFNSLKKSEQKEIVNDFVIEDFFEEFSSIFLSLLYILRTAIQLEDIHQIG